MPPATQPNNRRTFYRAVVIISTIWLVTTGLCSGGFFLTFLSNLSRKDEAGALASLIVIPIVSAVLALPLGFLARRWAKKKLRS